jgi:RND family efflux transporter MFP subunit
MRIKDIPAAFLILCWCLAAGGCELGQNEYVPPPPPEVTVALPLRTPVTPFLEQTGLTEAVEVAEIRARVDGFLQSIEFEPGQMVEADQRLYLIEPDSYAAEVSAAEAAVAAAVAAISVAEAMLEVAQTDVRKAQQDLDRETRLGQQGAGSRAALDTARAASDAAMASTKSAEASIQSATAAKGRAEAALVQAQLNLSYTEVRALIPGRITKTNFKLGNLVDNGSHLATIVNDDQIFANFSISDREVLRYAESKRGSASGEDKTKEDRWRGQKVYLRRETDQGFPFEGQLDYVDQAGIESSTGTLGLRAKFDNTNRELMPGLFVTVRIPMADDSFESLVIPESALLRDQQGVYVLTVGSEERVEKAHIVVPQSVSGWAIVQSGLDANSRVIIRGLQTAREGLPVKITRQEPLQVDQQMLMRGMSKPDAEPRDDADQPRSHSQLEPSPEATGGSSSSAAGPPEPNP